MLRLSGTSPQWAEDVCWGHQGSCRRFLQLPLHPLGALPVLLTCSTEWLLHAHFWPPQGTPVSAWHLVSRTLGPGPASCLCMKKMGRQQGEGSRGVCSILFIYIFKSPQGCQPEMKEQAGEVRAPNHVDSSRGTERSAPRGYIS